MEFEKFNKDKINKLNNFFMHSVMINVVISLVVFVLSVLTLLFVGLYSDLDQGIKISIISIVATFHYYNSKINH